MTASFASARYEVERDPEQPGDGVWREPTVVFGEGSSIAVVLRIAPHDADPWIAEFRSSEYSGYLTDWSATPDPDRLCVVAHGEAWLVEATTSMAEILPVFPVMTVFGAAECGLLLVGDFTELVAFGAGGYAWRSGRLVLDDLEVVGATESRIECRGSAEVGESRPFGVDPATGAQLDGPEISRPLLSRADRRVRRENARRRMA
jgi:hypothetical protein